MRLINGELRPGTVLQVVDNKGSIKAAVPGLFDKQDVNVLPSIHPWPVGAPNAFYCPKVGEEVWVLFFTDNPEELRWFRKDDYGKNNILSSNNGESLLNKKNVQVLLNEESGDGWASMYFDDGSGWVVKNQESIIQLDQDGNITITNGDPHRVIEINENGISIGSKGESAHPVPHGDKVQDLLEKIIDTFQAIADVAKTSPYTIAVATTIEATIEEYKNDPNYINSENVTVD